MRVNSLWFRLLVSSTVIACALLVAAAILLNSIFVAALRHNFDERLHSALDGLLANIELSADGQPALQQQLADTRFTLPLSGWYWQVNDAAGQRLLASPSLLEQQLSPNGSVDAHGANLRVVQEQLSLFRAPGKYTVLVAGNFDELKSEITSFQETLFGVLALLGLALLTALVLQVRFGLQPLNAIREEVGAIRDGRASNLSGRYPAEIGPLADELNKLMATNAEIVERSRMQVGNLAHALKTPISVMQNELGTKSTPVFNRLRAQLEAINTQVLLYLEGARRVARAHAGLGATEVEPVASALARALQRIHADRGMEFNLDIPANLRFRGEKQDLEEMLGNLMDNAAKWARHEIRVAGSASNESHMLVLDVEDDGPGIPEARRSEALHRGHRLDETKPGSGLGLSIVSETAKMYGGRLLLGNSLRGGLKATLSLPLAG